MFKDSNNDAGAIHIYILLKYELYGLILLCIYVICISVGNQTYILIWVSFLWIIDITCLALPFPDNGRIDVSTQDPTLNTLYYPMGSQSSYAIGTQASYACNPGFNPSRSDLTRTCLNNGTWDGNSVTCDGNF